MFARRYIMNNFDGHTYNEEKLGGFKLGDRS